jgi:dTDP-4-dehydrorhamnose reductase
VTEYGRQKARAEQAIAGFGRPSLVLRLTKVLGGNTGLFEQWARTLREGKEINPFSDMYMAPVPLAAVLSVLRLAMDRRTEGILHLSGDRDVSYAEIAYLLCERSARIVDCQARLMERGEACGRYFS